MKNCFTELTITVDSKSADKLSDIFFDLDVLSVYIEDADAGTPNEKPIFGEPGMIVDGLWNNSKLVVLLNHDANINQLVTLAKSQSGIDFDYTQKNIADEDWVRLTQSQFQPIQINPDFYIVPSWHEIPLNVNHSIILDPGLAFGTGSHATTFMCLEWLAEHITPQLSVLDYGCGSGILGITAKIFGAHTVYGVDIDEQAIIASLDNAKNNQVDIKFFTPDKLPDIKFDVVVANILSNPLRFLAPALAKITKSKLILSGILDSQSQELSEIYSKWFKVAPHAIKDGWVLLECTRLH
jgi:ribosomal protein L11 methyltransferase